MTDNVQDVLARVRRMTVLAQELAYELAETHRAFLTTLEHVKVHNVLIVELLQSGRTSEALDVAKHVAGAAHDTDTIVREHIAEFTTRHAEVKGHA